MERYWNEGGSEVNFFVWLGQNREAICIAFGVLVNAIGLGYNVYRFCRSGQGRRAQDWLAVLDAARELELEAEACPAFTAAEKLQYVLSGLNAFMAERGCRFDEESLIARVEADIAFSKQVNACKSERLE
jgi:hypothetical protein